MISFIGPLSLLAALFFSLIQGIVPLAGWWKQNPYLIACARPAAWGQCFFIFLAYLFLTISFVTNDFTIAYVAANSHPSLPLMYRLTAVWGAHEGSILLWVFILNLWTLVFSLLPNRSQLMPLTIAILGIISTAFICFLFFTSSPFLTASGFSQGKDLNPLLQDPGFVFHPPMLYTGYVGFAVTFAITQAALIRHVFDAEWARLARQFAIAAWCFLTLGITLGSWWAYRVLGWGGFWFWDPVENASLLPWLTGTGLIHLLLLTEKRGAAKKWAVVLATCCFALSLTGTFLVRSGVLVSVHSFASDPARGIFLLGLLALLLTTSLILFLVRQPSTSVFSFPLLSREALLFLNSAMLFIAALTVLLGTLYPLILDALDLGVISVGAPYFNAVMAPLTLILMLFMGLAPRSRWGSGSLSALWQSSWKKMLGSILLAIATLWATSEGFHFAAFISLALSFWVLSSLSGSTRKLPGMSFAHAGFAILVIGIMLSSLLSQEKEVRLAPGNAAKVGPYQFFFIDTQGIQGPNYRGIRASFDVVKKDRHITNLYPEKRIYTVRDMVMTNVDIHPGLFRDLYIALGEPLEQNAWSVRIYYKPFIRFIWLGGVLMVLGGLLSLTRREI